MFLSITREQGAHFTENKERMQFLAAIGQFFLTQLRKFVYLAAVIAAAVYVGFQPRHWSRAVRNVAARQVLFSGVDAINFIFFIAFLVGVSIVVQANVWLQKVGQGQLLGPILVTVVIRELGPLLANFVVIGRSGNAIAAELATMKVNGEVHVLDAQGLDPFVYLVIPRIFGFAVSVFCLTVLFFAVSLTSGYILSLFLGGRPVPPMEYIDNLGASLRPSDLILVPVKTILPAMLAGAICCTEGLSVGNAITDIPRATTRSLQRSSFGLFFISAAASFLSYL
jgi:phospholipid/cholesterol/gamma-HCH transport system permease protein